MVVRLRETFSCERIAQAQLPSYTGGRITSLRLYQNRCRSAHCATTSFGIGRCLLITNSALPFVSDRSAGDSFGGIRLIYSLIMKIMGTVGAWAYRRVHIRPQRGMEGPMLAKNQQRCMHYYFGLHSPCHNIHEQPKTAYARRESHAYISSAR